VGVIQLRTVAFGVATLLALLATRVTAGPAARTATHTRLVLLHDNSGSQILRLHYRSDTRSLFQLTTADRRRAVIRAITDHLDPTAQVRVATFGDRFLISPAWLRAPDELLEVFNGIMQSGGPSPIWDAIHETVGALEGFPGTRVVLLISDGRASGNVRGFQEAFARVRSSGVIFYVAALDASYNRRINEDRSADPTERLRALARATGGAYGEPEIVDLAATCATFAKAINVLPIRPRPSP
jgi:hypothetical protein